MCCREFPESHTPLFGQIEIYSPAVDLRLPAFDHPLRLQPVDQSYCAVVPYLQPLGELSHGQMIAALLSLDKQKRQILLWSQSNRVSGVFAEVQKPPEVAAKLSEHFVFRFVEFLDTSG